MSDRIDMVPMVQHRLLLDILPHEEVKNFWERMLLTPPSDDVLEVMQVESNARMQKITPLAPVCEMYIVLTADIITEAMYQRLLKRLDEDDDFARQQAEATYPSINQQNREVVRASLYSSLAHLVDDGFLTISAVPKVAAQ